MLAKTRYWYWEIIETYRRLALTGGLVLVAQGTSLQLVVALVIVMFFIKLYNEYSKYLI